MTNASADEDELEAASADPASLGGSIRRGLSWGLVGNGVIRLGSFVVSLVLAHLLSPADFGLYAIALSASQFLILVNDAGIISAVVQWRGTVEEVASTAAFLALGSSLLIYAGFWFAAPLYAELAGAPQAAPLLRIITFIIVIDGLTAVQNAILWRRFQQGLFMLANFAGFLAQAVLCVLLALHGEGAYSFAIGQVANSLITGALVLVFARHVPAYRLRAAVARRLIRFGIPLALSLGVQGVLLNVDFLIVGRVAGADHLGYYMLAFNISSWVPGLVGAAITPVSLAAFSRLAEGDRDALETAVHRALSVLLMAILPFAVILAILGPQLVAVLYGAKWAPSAVVLQLLAVLMVARMVSQLVTQLMSAMNRTVSSLVLNIVWLAALVPALLVGTRMDGISGAGLAHAAVSVVVAIPLCLGLIRVHAIRLGAFARSTVRIVLATVVAALMCFGVARLLAGTAVGGLLVGSVVTVLAFALVVVPVAHLDPRTWGDLRGRLRA